MACVTGIQNLTWIPARTVGHFLLPFRAKQNKENILMKENFLKHLIYELEFWSLSIEHHKSSASINQLLSNCTELRSNTSVPLLWHFAFACNSTEPMELYAEFIWFHDVQGISATEIFLQNKLRKETKGEWNSSDGSTWASKLDQRYWTMFRIPNLAQPNKTMKKNPFSLSFRWPYRSRFGWGCFLIHFILSFPH